MRTARIKTDGSGYYHCMSRVIERKMIFGDTEKEKFRKLMRVVEEFSGVRILTYAIMGNHFHLLVHVPERVEVTDAELLRRLGLLYGSESVRQIGEMLARSRAEGRDEDAEALRGRYLYRMHDISEFMKTLKQKYSMWHNKRNGRKGTLWEERFKSVVLEPMRVGKGVEGCGNALLTMAAYIDLNAVRAGLVKDPAAYRFCGYGEAMGGVVLARDGLMGLYEGYGRGRDGWGAVSAHYRMQLYNRGQAGRRPAFKAEEAQAVLDNGGRLGAGDVLRCRVRYFTDGVALGSRGFVEGVFAGHRDLFGKRRRDGARKLRHGDWGGLCVLRDLRLAAVTVPSTG